MPDEQTQGTPPPAPAASNATPPGGDAVALQAALDRAMADLEAERGKVKKHEAEKLTSEQRVAQENEELKGKLAAAERDKLVADVARQVYDAANTAGALYPDLIAGQVPPEDVLDRYGKAVGIEAAIKEMQKKYPNMFRAGGGSADGGEGGGGSGTGGSNMNSLIRRALGR